MSNNRMFAGSRYEVRGRNADISGTMFKRTPIFTHLQAEKPQSSPFSNYNCKVGQSFISDGSQNTQADERISTESIRQLIKQEMAKNQAPEQTNRKLIHTLQAQITDLKQRISEYDKENSQKLQETTVTLREEIRTSVENMGKEVEEEIVSKLRSFFNKANQELKKDILKYIEDEFLTTNYGMDLETRLQAINDRINSISNSVSTKQLTSKELEEKIEKANFAERIEPKITKIEKDIEQQKKQHQDIVSRMKPIEEWMSEASKRTYEEQTEAKMETFKEKIKALDQDLQKKFGAIQIQLSGTAGDINILKEKINELQKYNQEQRALFLNFNKKLSSSIDASADLTASLVLANPATIEKIKGQAVSTKRQEIAEQIKKTVYQVDNEGYLMDGEGKYLLTEEGTMIKLNQEQIEALIDSKAIQIIQS